jgi:hypothetical protein
MLRIYLTVNSQRLIQEFFEEYQEQLDYVRQWFNIQVVYGVIVYYW